MKKKDIGDLILNFYCEDDVYDINGNNLIINKNINIKQLYLGFEDKIILPNNEEYIYNIDSEELSENQIKIIKNKGLSPPSGQRGDVLIKYNIKFLKIKNREYIDKLFIDN